jgi:hypothetical protein
MADRRKPQLTHLKTLGGFHEAMEPGRVIVITDVAFPPKAHHADCPQLSDERFIKNVIENHETDGSYFSTRSLDEARAN